MSVILVTRPGGAGDPLVAELEERGYHVRAVPTVATVARSVDWPDIAGYDWVAATSAAGVATVPEPRAARRWAAVGQATADALRARGVEPQALPPEASGASLAESIPGVDGARVLFVRGSLASDDLARGLRARGASVDEVIGYDTVEGPDGSRAALHDALADGAVAAVVFASGSAVRGFLKLGGSTRIPAVTIGPRTSAAAHAANFAITAEASGKSAAALGGEVKHAIPFEVRRDA